MPFETWVTVLACGVALVALVAALLATSALRRLRAEVRRLAEGDEDFGGRTARGTTRASVESGPTDLVVYAPTPLEQADEHTRQVLPPGRAVATQEGTVIVLPSKGQVVAATMGRPLVRGAVLSHGLMYALRPESRDRIRGIVRREFRRRRKIRRRTARAAARSAPVSHDAPTSWIGGASTTPTQEGTR